MYARTHALAREGREMIDVLGFCQGCFLAVIDIDGGGSADDLPTLDLGSGASKRRAGPCRFR